MLFVACPWKGCGAKAGEFCKGRSGQEHHQLPLHAPRSLVGTAEIEALRKEGSMSGRTHRRNIIAVKGNGELTNVGRRHPRCESTRGGKQCCYVAGHEGYHCDQNGLSTWFDPP